MEYAQALAWVHGLNRMRREAGLERMKKLLAALGDPQRRLCFVHVAGTNGKGSVATMLSSIVKQSGYTVGMNVSPYIVDFRERMQINGEMIAEEQMAEVLTQVRTAAEGLAETPIEFEAVTAAAFLYFAQAGCDVVCMEAGIGGRLDSTNVVEDTLVACITRIGLDHTEILGETVAEIAREKCGIIKKGCVVVNYPQQLPEAAQVIERAAKAQDCPLVMPRATEMLDFPGGMPGGRARYRGLDLNVPFAGAHQVLNATVAVEAALALRDKGFEISDEAIERGIAAARIPARIEILRQAPVLIVDGAHSLDAAEVLAAELERRGLRRLVAVVGVLGDKAVESILKPLAPYIYTLYLVRPNSPRAMAAEELAALAKGIYPKVRACESVEQALCAALADAGEGVVVFGSLYLAAEARKILLNNLPFRA